MWDKVTLVESISGDYYYIPDYTSPHGFWLSKKYTSVEEAKKDVVTNWPNDIIGILDDKYFRVVKPFAFWSIKSGDKYKVKKSDERVLDYRSYASFTGIRPKSLRQKYIELRNLHIHGKLYDLKRKLGL